MITTKYEGANTEARIEYHIERFLGLLLNGTEDMGGKFHRENLRETPDRIKRTYQELLDGYHVADDFGVTFSDMTDMIVKPEIDFTSLCAHHLLQFEGTASIGYIPRNKVIGTSKIPRLVLKYAHRVQLQERMTKQIADEMVKLLHPLGVIVVVDAKHMCEHSRGIKNSGHMITSAVRGSFLKEKDKKAEFFELLKTHRV